MLGAVGFFQFTADLHSAVLTFDDVVTAEITAIVNGYGGLQWNNFGIANGSYSADYLSSVVSSPNVAFNLYGDPASFSSASVFALGSGHFKSVFADGLQLVVRGLLAGATIYSNAYVLNPAAPTFLQFNYSNVNEVKFTTSPANWFTMDNLAITFIPTNASCTFTIFPSYRYHQEGVETGSVAVTTQPGCEWAVSNTNSWLTITSGLNYTNTGNVSYTLTANTNGLTRSGFIEIAGHAFAISQYGELGTNWAGVILTFDDVFTSESTNFPANYGGMQWTNFLIGNEAISDTFSNGVVSSPNVAFNLYGDSASFGSASTFTLASGHFKALYEDGTRLIVHGLLTGTTIYSNVYVLSSAAPVFLQFNYGNINEVRFTTIPSDVFTLDDLAFMVTATNANCTFALSPTYPYHLAGAGTGSVTVTTQWGCEWDVTNTNSWIMVTSSLINTNSGIVNYTVTTNVTGVPRSGFINLAGQAFGVTQYGASGTNVVDVGQILTATIGHSCITNMYPPHEVSVYNYLVDLDQGSGGGGVPPSFSANFDTANQFVLKVSAPPGKRFLVHPPVGQAVRFGGQLYWESSRPLDNWPFSLGTVAVSFGGLEGTPPDFTASSSFLTELHGFFGFSDIVSTDFSNDLAFSSMTLAATVPSANVGTGTLNFNPSFSRPNYRVYDALFLTYVTPLKKDPGPFVSIVSIPQPVLTLARQPNGNVTITFTGILQYASEANGTFEDVTGYPQGTYTIPKANLTTHQYFRARGN